MKTLEQLEELYQLESKKNPLYYSSFSILDFGSWLDRQGYELNGEKPFKFIHRTHTVADSTPLVYILNNPDISVTNNMEKFKIEIIQLMQDRKLSFNDMRNVSLQLFDSVQEMQNIQTNN